MNLHPTFLEADGKPAFVVLPYAEYLNLIRAQSVPAASDTRIPADGTIPHEVIVLMTDNDWSIIRAWREYLGVTQTEMAARLDIRQPSYSAMEAPEARPRKTTRTRIATVLGLQRDQVDAQHAATSAKRPD
jgi:DNA-binding XRE family transcriptional regulator